MAEVIYVTCPLCGLNRVLDKKGSSAIARGLTISKVKGRIRFDQVDLDKAAIVQIRERKTGPEPRKRLRRGGGSGFAFKQGMTLKEMKDNPDYADLIRQLKSSCQNILKILS